MVMTLPHLKPTLLFLPPLGGEGRGGGPMNMVSLFLNRHPSLTLLIQGREQERRRAVVQLRPLR